MRTVWKFPLISTGPCDIDVPEGGVIKFVGVDPATGLLAFWAEVDANASTKPRRFQVCGTGLSVPDRAAHLGSVIQGTLVWHLYEIERPSDGSWS